MIDANEFYSLIFAHNFLKFVLKQLTLTTLSITNFFLIYSLIVRFSFIIYYFICS